MVYVHVGRRRLSIDSRPPFRMIKEPAEATLRDLVDQYLLDPGLPVVEEGIEWTLTGSGVRYVGTEAAPELAGPGEIELVRFVYGPHPEHERTIVEVREGALATRIEELPVLNDHRVAGFWWDSPTAVGP